MPQITLLVTSGVIRQVANTGDLNQRQIAFRDPSPELRATLSSAAGHNRIPLLLCGAFELLVGDTGAIWAGHQKVGLQAEDFTSFYDLLARRPGHPARFECEEQPQLSF
ncbi:MAG: hypothetical protein WCE75_05675 [Terracidiphilus sp.]